MKLNIVMLGMLLLLSLSVVSAQTIAQTPTTQQVTSQLWVRSADNVINVSMLVFTANQPSSAVSAVQAQYNDIVTGCQGSPDINQCIQAKSTILSSNAVYPVTFSSLEDANFTFMYWNPYRQGGAGWSTITGCGRVTANQPGTIVNITGGQIPLWTGTCTVDKGLYAGTTIQIRVLSATGDQLVAPVQSVTLSSANASAASNFTSALSMALAPVATNLSLTGQGQTVPCLGVFIILGLLLASMYFSGRSPITMLDITTPKLPSPKGLAAGGQIIAPFGYGEMNRTVKAKAAAAAKVADTLWNINKGKANQATIKQLEDMAAGKAATNLAAGKAEVGKLAGRMSAQEAAVFKSVGLAYVQGGGDPKALRALAKPFELYSKEDNASLRQVLKKLEMSKDPNVRLLGRTGVELRQNYDVLQSLAELNNKASTRTGKKIQTALRAVGVDKFAVAGPIVTGSYDAGMRSLKMLARGTQAGVVQGMDLARATGKFAVTTVGGKGAMDALKERSKSSGAYAALYNQLTKQPGKIHLGEIMPVNMRMSHQAEVHLTELGQDQNRHLLKRIYKQLGTNAAAVTDNEIFAMASSVVDPVRITGYSRSGRMAATESEIYAILSSASLSPFEKRDKLENLLQSLGGRLDASYLHMRSEVDKIRNDSAEGHVKMIMINELFDRENSARRGAGVGEAMLGDEYHCLVGRLGYLHGSDPWEVALFRKQIDDISNGHATKDVTLKDFMNALRVELENKWMTLNPAAIGADLLPEFMRDTGMRQKKTEENRKLLASLITDKGEEALKYLTDGKRNKDTATMDDFMHVLSGAEYMIKKRGLINEGGGVLRDPTTGKAVWYEDESAIGPQKGWFKTRMEQQWLNGIDTRELQLTTGTATQGKFDRSFVRPTNNSLQAELDRAGARTWSPEKLEFETKKAWARDLFEKTLHNTFSDRYAQNSYGNTTNESARYLTSASAAMLTKALREMGYEENHTDLRFLNSMDVTSPKDMERFRYMIGTLYKKQYEEVLKRGVSVDDLSKGVWVMTHEGTYIPYRENMPVSDNDRVLGGVVSIHDGKGWRRFSPEDVPVRFKGEMDLEWKRVMNSSDKTVWEPFINNLIEQTRPNGKGGNYEAEKVLAAVLWKYSNATYDYQTYWNKSAVKLVPRNQTTPLTPDALRAFGSDVPKLAKTLKPFHDFGQLVGDFLVNTAISGTGNLYTRSYDITPKTQLLKMYSWRLSTDILTSDMDELLQGVTSEADRRHLSAAYRSMALAHGAFHQVWAVTIDRSPWRNSTSHGAQQAWASAFQYGPNMTFSLQSTLSAYMSKGEYFAFMAQGGWAAALGRHAIMPYQKAIAGPQRSIQGYASSWDWDVQDALRPYGNHTSPRLLEAMRGYNPLSVSQSNGMFSRALQKANVYESRAEKAQLAGYDHSKGLYQDFASIQTVYKGPAAIARTRLANPSASYTDTRGIEQLEPAMAEYALMSMGGMSGFYMHDDYVRKMGMTDIIRRPVAVEVLAMRREQELASFGMLNNPLYTFFNPLLFAYHMGVPGYPSTLSPKEMIYNFVNRWRNPDPSRKGGLEQSVNSLVQRGGAALNRAVSPQMASRQRYCRCGRSGQMGTMCACGLRL